MKKILVLTVISLMSFVCNAQKDFRSETKIINGKNTGNTIFTINAKGYFSSAEETDACAILKISFTSKKGILKAFKYNFYPYCDMLESKSRYIMRFIGTTTNEVTGNNVVTWNYLTSHFLLLCENNDTIKVRMIENFENTTFYYNGFALGVRNETKPNFVRKTTAEFTIYNCKEIYNEYVNRYGEVKVYNGPGLQKLNE